MREAYSRRKARTALQRISVPLRVLRVSVVKTCQNLTPFPIRLRLF